MSIDAVEQNPEGDDVVHISDPGQDRQTEPSGGAQALDSISHILAHGKTKDLRRQPGFEHMPERTAKGAYTGTRDAPERFVHDEAVQVRQLVATAWDTRQIPVGVNPSTILPGKPERMGLQIVNLGPATVYVGPKNRGTIVSGFPLAVGAGLALTAASEVWASYDPATGASAILACVEQWRTDNSGN